MNKKVLELPFASLYQISEPLSPIIKKTLFQNQLGPLKHTYDFALHFNLTYDFTPH